jgi:uncharacterized protein
MIMGQTITAHTAAARLYSGKVMHQRMKPFGHRFEYKVFSLLLDLDQLQRADRLSRLFSVNRFNLVSFKEADHIDTRISPVEKGIRAYADRLFANAGMQRPARIELLAYPRVFGHAFNPISLYYAYDDAGLLTGMIYEVRNTFGERHTYVCPVEPGQLTQAGLRQTRTKIFHVSPFIEMGMRYDFRVRAPGGELQFRILESDGEGPLLAASFSGKATPLSTASLAAQLAKIPFLGFKIVGGIHFEALRLWLKGAKFKRSPPPPEPASYVQQHFGMPGE